MDWETFSMRQQVLLMLSLNIEPSTKFDQIVDFAIIFCKEILKDADEKTIKTQAESFLTKMANKALDNYKQNRKNEDRDLIIGSDFIRYYDLDTQVELAILFERPDLLPPGPFVHRLMEVSTQGDEELIRKTLDFLKNITNEEEITEIILFLIRNDQLENENFYKPSNLGKILLCDKFILNSKHGEWARYLKKDFFSEAFPTPRHTGFPEPNISFGLCSQFPEIFQTRLIDFLLDIGHTVALRSANEDAVGPLVDILMRRIRRVGTRELLIELFAGETDEAKVEAICRLLPEAGGSRELLMQLGIKPVGGSELAVFYFFTCQWSHYEKLDSDGVLIGQAFWAGNSSRRKVIRSAALDGCRKEFLQLLLVDNRDAEAAGLSDDDWDAAMRLLKNHPNWSIVREVLKAAPAGWVAVFLQDWQGTLPEFIPAVETSRISKFVKTLQDLAHIEPELKARWTQTWRCPIAAKGFSFDTTGTHLGIKFSGKNISVFDWKNNVETGFWRSHKTERAPNALQSKIRIRFPFSDLDRNFRTMLSVRGGYWRRMGGYEVSLAQGGRSELRVVVDAPDGRQSVFSLESNHRIPKGAALGFGGNMLATSTFDGVISFWEPWKARLIATISGPKGLPEIDLLLDEKLTLTVAGTREDKCVYVYTCNLFLWIQPSSIPREFFAAALQERRALDQSETSWMSFWLALFRWQTDTDTAIELQIDWADTKMPAHTDIEI
jgi:hypothetical protein